MNAKALFEQFDELTTFEKKEFYRLIKMALFPDDTKINQLVSDLRESRFSKGLQCPHCNSKAIKRNGKYRGRQRYLCRECGKTFNDTTSSPLAGTHYPHKWLKYIEFMVEGKSLAKIAEELKIHISTAFYWRHKVLFALRFLDNQALSGIVEADDTFFRESEKGNRHLTWREPREHGRVKGKKKLRRGISGDQDCVVVAMDRDGHLVLGKAGRGRVKAQEIDKVIGSYITSDSTLCTDAAKNFISFAGLKGVEHKAVKNVRGQRVKDGLYHIQHINSCHGRLKKWMTRFHGVASKYLDNYMTWFKFLDNNSKLGKDVKKQTMLVLSCKKVRKTTVSSFKNAS